MPLLLHRVCEAHQPEAPPKGVLQGEVSQNGNINETRDFSPKTRLLMFWKGNFLDAEHGKREYRLKGSATEKESGKSEIT